MKVNLLFILVTLVTFLSAVGQQALPDLSYSLIASKNRNEAWYNAGMRLCVKYKNPASVKRVKGIFAGVSDGEILVARKKKSEEGVLVPVEEIIAVRKINPRKRIVYGTIGALLVGGGGAIIDKGGNTPGSAMKGAFIIPLIGVGSYFLAAIPVSMLLDKAGEKKRSSGWEFQLRK
jgi:hypothetical protein